MLCIDYVFSFNMKLYINCLLSQDGETNHVMNDRGGKGKMSGRVAKQRAIARGDNLAPTQVNSTPVFPFGYHIKRFIN